MIAENAVGLPAPALRPLIARYAGLRATGLLQGAMHRGVPSRHVHLIVRLDGPIELVRAPLPSQRPGRFTALVGGLQDAPAIVRDGESFEGLHLFLTPLGVRSLLGVTSAELAGRVVELADLWGTRAGHLVERLAAAEAWHTRFAILDDTFMAALRPFAPARDLAWAWTQLARHGGRVPIRRLADDLGWSRRHFGERFRAELGLAPKTAARVFRFERACRLIMDKRPPLADVAAACGYHDQAHLTSEWNALAGCTPRAWMAAELPFLQDYEVAGRDDGGTDYGDAACPR